MQGSGSRGGRPGSVLSLNFDFQKALNLIRSPKSSINLPRFSTFLSPRSMRTPKLPLLVCGRATSKSQPRANFITRPSAPNKSDLKVIRHLAVIASQHIALRHSWIHSVSHRSGAGPSISTCLCLLSAPSTTIARARAHIVEGPAAPKELIKFELELHYWTKPNATALSRQPSQEQAK